ncbi:hypothetical protein ALC57_07940 [Trachymyrmex cornetzi]|uniref:Uncharacterized protein n=1 Tax=Trachymyrmex cornetzi TaxID=471704 RepID=A0A151J7B2_9HYME|nr:hypothetical protein ALC57_07940 [Trachymyrmex cornetzi]
MGSFHLSKRTASITNSTTTTSSLASTRTTFSNHSHLTVTKYVLNITMAMFSIKKQLCNYCKILYCNWSCP